jgi:hypothetical protein
MSTTLEERPSTGLNGSDTIATIPAATASTGTFIDTTKEDIATIKQAVKTVFSFAGVLFLLAILFSRKTETVAPTAPAANPAAATASTAAAVPSSTPAIGTPGGRIVSFPKELTAHHISGVDYSLTWKGMGDNYTYRIYYANDKQMHDAQSAFFKPVDGTTWRFTIDGNPKNVWMAVTPINGNGQEGILSRPVNIGDAKEEK